MSQDAANTRLVPCRFHASADSSFIRASLVLRSKPVLLDN
jgi:hypothetical protein